MATDTAGGVGQELAINAVHYLAKTVTNADDDLVVTVGWLPPGAVVIDVGIVVTTAFAGGSVVADIGTAADPDAFGSALVLTTAGAIRDVSTDPLLANDDYSATASVAVVVSITSGSTITAGSGVVFATYVLPR